MKKFFCKIMLLTIFLISINIGFYSFFSGKTIQIHNFLLNQNACTFNLRANNNTQKTTNSTLCAKNFENLNNNFNNSILQNLKTNTLLNLNSTTLFTQNLNLKQGITSNACTNITANKNSSLCTNLCSKLGLFTPAKLSSSDTKKEHTFDESLYKFYHYISPTNFYYVNLQTNKIEHYNNGEITSFGEYGNLDGQFTQIKFFKLLQNGEFMVLDSLNRLQFFNSNFNHIKTLQHIKDGNNFLSLGTISSISCDIYSSVYLLDTTNGYILKANSSMDNLEVITTLTLAENSQVTYLNTCQNLAVLSENNIILNSNTKNVQNLLQEYQTSQNLEITTNLTANFIFSDAQDYIFVVCNEVILKLNTNLEIVSLLSASLGREYNINLQNGEIYYLLNSAFTVISNFATDISTFAPPVDINDTTLLTNQIEILQTINQANLLNNPFSNQNSLTLNTNSLVLKLGETVNLQNNFYYVLYIQNDTHTTGYIEKKFLTSLDLTQLNLQVLPTRTDVKYYKYPTALIDNLQSLTLNSNQVYNATRKIEYAGKTYLEISLEDNFVYVLETELINADQTYINTYLNTNAKLKLYNHYTQILVYDSINKETRICSLTKNTNVKIIEKGKTLTKVSFIYENQIVTGYVENKFIVKETNYTMPLTIILTLVCVILLVVIIFSVKKMKNRKQM